MRAHANNAAGAPPQLLCGCAMRNDDDRAQLVADLDELCGGRALARTPRRLSAGEASAEGRGTPHARAASTRGAAPHLLFLTRHQYFAGVCALVDRRTRPGQALPRITMLRMGFDDTLFDGTVIEGELSPAPAPASSGSGQGPSWAFDAYDVLASAGERVDRLPLASRLEHLYRLVAQQHFPDSHDALALRAKQFHLWDDPRSPPGPCICKPLSAHPAHKLCGWIAPPSSSNSNNNNAPAGRKPKSKSKPKSKPKPMSTPTPTPCARPAREEDRTDASGRERFRGPAQPPAAPAAPAGRVEAAPDQSREFVVRDTGKPDVYELFESDADASRCRPCGQACVPSMSASRAMRAALDGRRLARLEFERHPRLGGWVMVVRGDA